jgi:hypothetical protein
MIWIDLENRLPTDTNIPGWTAWSQKKWADWKAKSERLLKLMHGYEKKKKRKWRNRVIDDHSDHWGCLKPWLEALSANKCWFSEVRDLYSHYDVEHFRPKKEAKTIHGLAKDGYWWLAFDYMNFRLCGNVGNRKKGAWFPIKNGSQRSTYIKRCEGDEEPHFLDPTNAHDVGLLAFDEEGKAVPAPGISRWEKVRVLRTVQRLKLTEHQALTEERRKIWQQVTQKIGLYKQELAKARYSAAARNEAKNAAKEIKLLTSRNAPLSSVARWCVLLKNDHQLAKLID